MIKTYVCMGLVLLGVGCSEELQPVSGVALRQRSEVSAPTPPSLEGAWLRFDMLSTGDEPGETYALWFYMREGKLYLCIDVLDDVPVGSTPPVPGSFRKFAREDPDDVRTVVDDRDRMWTRLEYEYKPSGGVAMFDAHTVGGAEHYSFFLSERASMKPGNLVFMRRVDKVYHAVFEGVCMVRHGRIPESIDKVLRVTVYTK